MRRRNLIARRAALQAAGLLAAGGAAAQSSAQIPGRQTPPAAASTPPVVRPPPLPCADRPGDIVGLTVEGPAPAGVVVFGQAFAPGHLPAGARIAARLQPGAAIPAQLDALRHHADGSIRHALVSLALPQLAAGEVRGVVLARGQGPAPAPLDLDAALAGREAVVELAPVAGGPPWRAELLALARALGGRPWQSGPLAWQQRVAVRVPPEVAGGAGALRLVADLSLRADQTLWVDLWLRNDLAMQRQGGTAAYRIRLRLDGREVLAAEVPRHFQYTGWGRLNGARRGSSEPPEAAHVCHDIGYLGGPAAAILPYDLSTGVAEAVLAGMARLAAQPGWDEPFHPRGVQTQMGLGGARPDLGQTTHWQAAWLLSGDRRAARVALGQAEAAANIPWHFWDPTGGARGSGGWLDVTRWPGIWTDPRGGPPPRGLSQPVAPREQTGWAPLPSHAPALSYVPYLLTGRRAFLDNQSAQAAWTVVGAWPAVRQLQIPLWPLLRSQPTPAPAEDMLVAFGQPRTGAWNLRTLGETAWIAPDDDPNRAHFADVEARNWAWLLRMIPEWTALQGEAHGYMMQYGFGRQTGMTLFQSEYYASTAARAALRGNAEARTVAAWMRNFLVGRFLAEAQGFAREDAIAYVIAITEEPPPAAQQPPRTPFRTWAEIGRATQARNLGNGPTWRHSDGEYGRLALLSLALLHHALGDPDALAAYDWLAGSGAPHTRLEAFQRMPQHNVAPRGRARVAAGAPACARAPG